MAHLQIQNAVLDRNTVQHIEIDEAFDNSLDEVRLYAEYPGTPIVIYLEHDAAIELAVALGLESDLDG